MAMAALRAFPASRGSGVLRGEVRSLRGEAGPGGYLHLQHRAAYTESEGKALARVRRLAEELNKSVETFPEPPTEDLSLSFVKLRQHQKYYKNGMWVLISLYASLSLTGSYALLQLDRDVTELKEMLTASNREIMQLKRQSRMMTSCTPPPSASGDVESAPASADCCLSSLSYIPA